MKKNKIPKLKHFDRLQQKRDRGEKLTPSEAFYFWYWAHKIGGEL